MITALLYNSCTSCRKTEEVLKASGADYEKREFFKQRLTRDELSSMLDSVGLTANDVLSTRSRPYKEMGLAEKSLSDDELLNLMVEEPRLLRRPIVIRDGEVVVGHNEAKLRELIGE
ncbi:MAG TPA: arsenate reductase family protein [Thermomicrobiales bacterium]|nr:arsenate reductase family protein [Thermomicrobiales bacterium]